ncbi:MAG: methyltransferase domain-containing protein, partial [Ilumatobacter sp.]
YEASSDTYRLPSAVATALADPASPFWMAGGLVGTQALYLDLDQGIEALRGDGAVGWGEHHHYFFEGTEELFRPAYDHLLIQHWMPALSCGVDRLNAGIAVADIGCGNGASTVRMARAFPDSSFTGFDFHAPSVEAARANAAELGLENVSFEVASADGYSGPFDLICFFDCLHDMGDPVGAAAHARSQLAADGHLMLVEPFAKDSREDNHGFMAALRYGMSLFGCVPCSLAQEGAAGLGNQAGETGMRTIFETSGFSTFTRIAETPNNIVYEAIP